jgi:hypothetical protein
MNRAADQKIVQNCWEREIETKVVGGRNGWKKMGWRKRCRNGMIERGSSYQENHGGQ